MPGGITARTRSALGRDTFNSSSRNGLSTALRNARTKVVTSIEAVVVHSLAPSRLEKSSAPIASASSPSPDILSVTIPIRPLGKPRMTQSDKWKERATVLRYRTYCDQLRAAFNRTGKFLTCRSLVIKVVFGTKKDEMWGLPHDQKPDADNILKGVMDALLIEDERVNYIELGKFWGMEDRLYLKLAEVVYL